MLYAVIMAGGLGTRFWPWSREKRPKQLLKIAGKDTMIKQTIDRIVDEILPDDIYIVTTSIQADSIKEELPEIPAKNIISEPFGRNTAACIGLAATIISKRDTEATMAVMTADHIIGPSGVFLKALRSAERLATETNALVTFGIKPNEPSVNYGYIQRSKEGIDFEGLSVYDAECFKEKPDRATAESFVQSGEYYWNSGIFVWTVNTILENLKNFVPKLASGLTRIAESVDTPNESQVIRDEYEGFESISIDYAVMERASNVKIVEANFEWDDVGSWLAVKRLNKSDENDNTILGKHCGINTNGNIIVGDEKRLIATINVSDLIIVNTKDVTMVCNKNNAEDIKKMTDILREKGLTDYL